MHTGTGTIGLNPTVLLLSPPTSHAAPSIPDQLRRDVDEFIASWRVRHAVSAHPVLGDVRLEDRPNVLRMISEASPRAACARHDPEALRQLAFWAEERLNLEGVAHTGREGFVMLDRNRSDDRRSPGTHVIMRREIDGWRLARVDRVWMPPNLYHDRALLSPWEFQSRGQGVPENTVPSKWWRDPTLSYHLLIMTGRRYTELGSSARVQTETFRRMGRFYKECQQALTVRPSATNRCGFRIGLPAHSRE